MIRIRSSCRQVAVVEDELRELALLPSLMRILKKVIDPAGIKRGGAALDAVHLVALLKQLRQIAAVLPRDASDQSSFGRMCVHEAGGGVGAGTAEERLLMGACWNDNRTLRSINTQGLHWEAQ